LVKIKSKQKIEQNQQENEKNEKGRVNTRKIAIYETGPSKSVMKNAQIREQKSLIIFYNNLPEKR